MNNAFNYVIKNGGIDTGEFYPYKAVQSTCKYDKAYIGATCTGYVDVQSGSESALMTALAKGPVSVAIDAGRYAFRYYKSGVHDDSTCSSTQLNHGGEFTLI
jgi:cathepsin L